MLVTRTYLELRREWAIPPARAAAERGDAAPIVVERAADITPARYRELYTGVGAAYRWHDRNAWSDQRLAAHLADPAVTVWLGRAGLETVGWAELVWHAEDDLELAYFGLLPSFHGRGFGRAMLEQVIELAWQRGATRLWLHTCTLDSAAALPNYRARGFRSFREERYEVPDSPGETAGPDPCGGANRSAAAG